MENILSPLRLKIDCIYSNAVDFSEKTGRTR